MMSEMVFAILTVSDTCHYDASKDRSGPRLVELIMENYDGSGILKEILPDEQDLISKRLKELSEDGVSCILTTGGTGFSPRDVTPEATKAVVDKECPHFAMAMTLHSLEKTKFAALSRAFCGIAGTTLIINLPGSSKAVDECFGYIKGLLPHALHILSNDEPLIRRTHDKIQGKHRDIPVERHICPHKTGKGDAKDRNSPYPMLPVDKTLNIIFEIMKPEVSFSQILTNLKSAVNIPPFQASIKDGYAMKSSGFAGSKTVLGYISAGDVPIEINFHEDECYKINTGAPLPLMADCVIQIEDTKLLKTDKNGLEDLVEILVEPKDGLNVRPIGSDLAFKSKIFPTADFSPVVVNSLMVATGCKHNLHKPSIAIISTGNELLDLETVSTKGKIYDSNTTMLQQLLQYFGFECKQSHLVNDDFDELYQTLSSIYDEVDVVISSGGVSMGDKDYIKSVLLILEFQLHVGRVNMKPGKPMTFASKDKKYFFGLPGNPVSAFVCFHMLALPALRWASGWSYEKCKLPVLQVTLQNESIPLDPRPEYMCATITSKNGLLYASIEGKQMSSRLQSIVGADVLVHLPAYTETKKEARAGDVLSATVLRYDFITKYE